MAKLRTNQFTLPSGAVITEHPILFQTEMVKANLEDQKNQTRRTRGLDVPMNLAFDKIEFRPNDWPRKPWIFKKKIQEIGSTDIYEIVAAFKSPYGKPGDLLWVKETWQESTWLPKDDGDYGFIYRASENGRDWELSDDSWTWKPSIHLPKVASRIWAMVEEIRVERVQDISEEDAMAEGVSTLFPLGHKGHEPDNFTNYTWHGRGGDDSFSGYSNAHTAKESFQSLWYAINGQSSWDSNPWVWVIKYRILSKTGRPSMEVIEKNYFEVKGKEVSNV